MESAERVIRNLTKQEMAELSHLATPLGRESPMQVIIRHPKTGAEYEIDSADFRRGKHYQQPGGEMVTYESAGFRIVSLPDGQPYEGPLNDAPAARSEPAKD